MDASEGSEGMRPLLPTQVAVCPCSPPPPAPSVDNVAGCYPQPSCPKTAFRSLLTPPPQRTGCINFNKALPTVATDSGVQPCTHGRSYNASCMIVYVSNWMTRPGRHVQSQSQFRDTKSALQPSKMHPVLPVLQLNQPTPRYSVVAAGLQWCRVRALKGSSHTITAAGVWVLPSHPTTIIPTTKSPAASSETQPLSLLQLQVPLHPEAHP